MGKIKSKKPPKKKPKKKRCDLTDRDFRIFYHLSFGPSTSECVSRIFFPKQTEEDRRLDGSKTADIPSSFASFRIRQLVNAGYIQTKKHLEDTILKLTKTGATLAAEEFNGELDKISYSDIDTHVIENELMAASSLRAVVLPCGHSEDSGYKVNWYETAKSLRINGDKKQKRAYLPDFMVSVTDLAGTKVFSFMTDYATGCSVIFDKVSSFKGDAIIIAGTVLWLEVLFGYLIEDKQHSRRQPQE